MNFFAILEKSDIKIAVNLDKEGAENELDALKLEGYRIVVAEIDAEDSNDAIQKAKRVKKTQ